MERDDLEAARRTWRAIEARLVDPATGLFGERGRPFRRRRWRYARLWPFTCAWSAMCALGALGEDQLPRVRLDRQLQALEAFRRPGDDDGGLASTVVSPRGTGGERYFDDNAWAGLALCRQARLTGDERAWDRAASLCGFAASGWVADDHVAHPGGIRWKEGLAAGSRNACSNAPVAELAATLHLAGRDGAGTWLERAVAIYGWTREALRTVHGLYADRIAPDGTVTSTVLSYNQGTMIGAGVLLQRATGEDRYLDDARRTAAASLGRYGNAAALGREPPAFAVVYLRNLLLLDQVAPDPAHRRLAEGYAVRLLAARRADGLVRSASGQGSPLQPSAALVEVLALLAGAEAAP